VDRRPSDIRLSSDVIDQNGQAIFTDSPSDLNVYATNNGSIIAPWTDYTVSAAPRNRLEMLIFVIAHTSSEEWFNFIEKLV